MPTQSPCPAWPRAGIAGPSAQATVGLVNFDPPTTPQGPSIYVAVPGPQTIVTPEATFSGGVVLGLATFFPAIQYATIPNVYGTADFGHGLATALTIAINPNFVTTELSFALFNGETFRQSYVVDAYNGSAKVATQAANNILPNFNSGFALVDMVNAGGGKEWIAPPRPGACRLVLRGLRPGRQGPARGGLLSPADAGPGAH